MSEENVSVVNDQTPLVQVYPDKQTGCAEILMWAIAILSSSWTEWIFAAKSNNPYYNNNIEKAKASSNAIICYPYIKKSIIDAMSAGNGVGIDAKMNFRPEEVSAKFKLQKDT